MAGPVLADVEDGVTAVAEASVNQYKTAILLTAGAGWDAATDLDLEHASDEIIAARGGLASLDTRLDVSLDNAGTIKAGAVNKQTMLALDGAAAATGDAVRFDEFNVDHDADGAHGAGVIVVDNMAAGVLSGKGNTAARPAAAKAGYLYVNTQTKALERDTGAAFEEATGVISAANVTDLTDAGETTLHTHPGQLTAEQKTDLTDGGATTLHSHKARFCLWSQSSVQAAANADAPVSAIYSKTDANTDWVNIAQIAFYKSPEIDSLVLRYEYVAGAGGVGPKLKISDSAATATVTVDLTADGVQHAVESALDVSGIADDTVCDIEVAIRWATAGGGAHDLQVRRVSLWAEPVSGPA